jgi:hypothetical protein
MEQIVESSMQSNLLKAKKLIRTLTSKEERALKRKDGDIEGEVWQVYYGNVKDYDRSFAEILSDLHVLSLKDILAQRREKGLTTNVLDLMGGEATFLRSLSPLLDSGLCISLVDERKKKTKSEDRKNNIYLECGDITSKHVWKKIDDWQRKKRIKSFDLVVCRGAGGMIKNIVPKMLYPYLFSKVWERLSGNDGVFITQLPDEKEKEMIEDRLSRIKGLKFYFQQEKKMGWDYREYGMPALSIMKISDKVLPGNVVE